MQREVLKGSATPAPMAHYCQGVRVGDMIYAAGQIASDYQTGVPSQARQDPAFPYYGSHIQKQARYILQNLRSVLQAGGCDLTRAAAPDQAENVIALGEQKLRQRLTDSSAALTSEVERNRGLEATLKSAQGESARSRDRSSPSRSSRGRTARTPREAPR